MTRLVITGASGFLGRQVMHLLRDRDWTIVPVSSHDVDLRRPAEAIALVERTRPTHLLHLAWNAKHGEYWTAPDNVE